MFRRMLLDVNLHVFRPAGALECSCRLCVLVETRSYLAVTGNAGALRCTVGHKLTLV